jgi:hypothetical protein
VTAGIAATSAPAAFKRRIKPIRYSANPLRSPVSTYSKTREVSACAITRSSVRPCSPCALATFDRFGGDGFGVGRGRLEDVEGRLARLSSRRLPGEGGGDEEGDGDLDELGICEGGEVELGELGGERGSEPVGSDGLEAGLLVLEEAGM